MSPALKIEECRLDVRDYLLRSRISRFEFDLTLDIVCSVQICSLTGVILGLVMVVIIDSFLIVKMF